MTVELDRMLSLALTLYCTCYNCCNNSVMLIRNDLKGNCVSYQ